MVFWRYVIFLLWMQKLVFKHRKIVIDAASSIFLEIIRIDSLQLSGIIKMCNVMASDGYYVIQAEVFIKQQRMVPVLMKASVARNLTKKNWLDDRSRCLMSCTWLHFFFWIALYIGPIALG